MWGIMVYNFNEQDTCPDPSSSLSKGSGSKSSKAQYGTNGR